MLSIFLFTVINDIVNIGHMLLRKLSFPSSIIQIFFTNYLILYEWLLYICRGKWSAHKGKWSVHKDKMLIKHEKVHYMQTKRCETSLRWKNLPTYYGRGYIGKMKVGINPQYYSNILSQKTNEISFLRSCFATNGRSYRKYPLKDVLNIREDRWDKWEHLATNVNYIIYILLCAKGVFMRETYNISI